MKLNGQLVYLHRILGFVYVKLLCSRHLPSQGCWNLVFLWEPEYLFIISGRSNCPAGHLCLNTSHSLLFLSLTHLHKCHITRTVLVKGSEASPAYCGLNTRRLPACFSSDAYGGAGGFCRRARRFQTDALARIEWVDVRTNKQKPNLLLCEGKKEDRKDS